MPEVSVIIPVYNTEQFLGNCLDSVLAQTFTDFEAIVVDDGSTDKSADIIEAFAKKDSRIVPLKQENKGPSEARNAALDIAKGNWIIFIDSDDIVSSTLLLDLLDAAKNSQVQVAAARSVTFRSELTQTASAKSATPKVITAESALEKALYQKDFPDYSLWGKIFDATLWKERRLAKGYFFEDLIAVTDIFQNIGSVALADKPLYFYRKHPGSALANQGGIKTAVLLDICEGILESFEREDKTPVLKKAAENSLFSASCSILMRTPDTDEFKDFRTRAWDHIRALRTETLFNSNSRTRNKVAALCSFGGRTLFEHLLRRFG